MSSRRPLTPAHRRAVRRRSRLAALSAIVAVVLSAAVQVVAPPAAEAIPPFPINDTTAGAPGTLNPNWTLQANGTTTTAGAGRYTSDGWTRLNGNGTGQVANLLNNLPFASSSGFQVEFDYRMAGGTQLLGRTGDGISFYLVDGTATISDGGPGAGLAYANSDSGCGVNGGWLGLGLDVYGNFSQGTNTFGNFGPSTAVATSLGSSSLVLRGSGPLANDGCNVSPGRTPASNQFPFLDGRRITGLWTGTAGSTADPAAVANSLYRRVRIQITPQSTTQLSVSVAITPPAVKTNPNPGAFTTAFSGTINSTLFPGQRALPPTLKLGFGASSGTATDYKGIRNVRVSAITDLAITKALASATPGHTGLPAGTFLPGDQVSFTMTGRNNGPTAVGLAPNGVAYVSDDLSGLPLSNVTWTCTAAGGATCVTASGSGPVVRAPWVGPAGGSVTVTATGTVSATAPSGTYTNTAVIPTEFTGYTLTDASSLVQPDGGLGDNDLANNTASAPFTVAAPTLSLSKALAGSRVAGADQFTTAIRTGGAAGPVVSATGTATTSGTGSTVAVGTGTTGTFTGTGNTAYTLTESMATGSASTLGQYVGRITCTDANGLQAGLPSGAAFTGALTITPVSGAAISCVVTNAPAPASLTLTKALAAPRVGAGDQFTVQVRQGSATGTVVNSTTASTTTGTGTTVTAGSGTTGVTALTPGTTYHLTEQAAGTTSLGLYTARVTCTDSAGFQTGLPSNAVLSGSLAITPVNGAQISCTFSNATTPAQLSLSKTNPPALAVGAPASYALTVTNAGGTPAATATVVDRLPAGVAYAGSAGAGWTCTASGTVAAGQTVSCSFAGTIAGGGGTSALRIDVVPQTSAAGTTAVNRAAVDTTGGTTPVDPTTCTATGTSAGCAVTPGLPVGNGVNLTLAKTAPPTLAVDRQVGYTLTVTNAGTGPAATATVRDQLPPNIRYDGFAGAGWTCAATGTVAAGQLVTCTFSGAIAPAGGTAQVRLDVTPLAGAAGQSVVNRAAVDPSGGTSPVAPGTCTATGTPAGCAVTTAQGVVLVDAVDDSATTVPTVAVSVPVLGNDTVVGGTALRPASVTVTRQPAGGTVAVDPATGSVTYTPNPGFSGVDTFDYQVCDTSAPTPVCDTATVTLRVTSTVVANDDTVSTPQNTPTTVTLLANDTASPGGAPLNPASVAVLAQPTNGTVVVNANGTATYTPNPGFSGVDSATYQVCDTSTPTPVCDTATLTVTVGANVVSASDDLAITAPTTPVRVPVLGNDTSATGQPLNPASVAITQQPTGGTVTIDPATGAITYTPRAGFSGTDVLVYTVCDTSTPVPACDTASVTISVPSAVTAVDDTATTPQNAPVATPVTANDTVTQGGAPLNPASVAVTAQPSNGTVTVGSDGVLTYTPAAGFTGTDSYTYRVCDTSTPAPVCDTATVTVTVGANVVDAADDAATTSPTVPVTIDLLANDSTSTGQGLDATSTVVATGPAHGTVTVDPATGVAVYTPAADFSGVDQFVYTVCDTSFPTPVCDTATVTVSVPTTITAADDTAVTAQNTAVPVAVLANDSVTSGAAPLDPASVAVTRAPASGSTSVDPATGVVTYTPAPGFSGTVTFDYTVCDTSTPTVVCDTATVTVTVGSNVVDAVADTATTVPTVPVDIEVLLNDTSATGQPLAAGSVRITTPPTGGTATVDPATGVVTYTPRAGFSGEDTFTYEVCDTSTPTAVCDSAVVTVAVRSDVVANPDTATTAQNTPVTVPVLGNDTVTPGGSPLDPASTAVVVPPANGTVTIDPASGAITYTPNPGFSGTDSLTYRVCDSSTPTPACDTATVSITVGANTVDAVDDAATTSPATDVEVDLLDNDTVSPGGAALNPGSVAVTQPPAHGTASIDLATGVLTYTPAAGFSGVETVVYQVCDTSVPTAVCDTATVTITVPNAVTAVDDVAATAQNEPAVLALLDNDTVTTDGAPLAPASVTVTRAPGNGTVTTDPATGDATYVPAPGFSGVDSFDYSVCDTSTPTPVCDTATATITVAANTVTAVDDLATTGPATAVEIPLLANDDVGNGGAALAPASVVVTTPPTHGAVTIDPATGSATYTPEAGFSGVDTFVYSVCDTSSPTPVCDTAGVTVTVPNAVDAVDDPASTPQNTPVTVPVLGNDTVTANGSPLDPASVEVLTAPAHGSAVIGPDGTITYTPSSGWTGTDSFTYTVCDSSDPTPVCDTATVTVTTAANVVDAVDDPATTPPATPVVVEVLGNDTVASGGAPLDPASVDVPGAPAHGSVTVDASTGAVTYTPDAGFSGTDAFTYSVCDTSDPEPVCDTATVTVTVPSAVDAVDDTAVTEQNAPVTIVVLGNDTVTPDGAPLDPASVTVATEPNRGTVTIDEGTGAATYTPDRGFSGEDTFSYTVCDTSDPTPVCDTATVTVTVGANVVDAVADSATTQPVTAVEVDVLDNDTTATGQGLDPSSVTVTVPPARGTATVDAATGVVTYTPADGFSGSDTFTYQVCDTSTPTPVCDTAVVTVTVPNAVVAVPDPATTPQNTPVVVPVLDNDTVSQGGAPLDPASVTVSTPPANGTTTVDPATGAVTYTPAPGFSGTDSFGYTVCDTSSPTPVCVTATVTVTVGSNTVTPVDDVVTTAPATPVPVDVLANDQVSAGGAALAPSSVQVTAAPAHGTTSVDPATGVITYTPEAGFSGTDTFTYTVCDTSTPTAVCGTAGVTVTVPSTVTAVDDTATTPQNAPVTVAVLDNDTVTADGSPLDPASVAVLTPAGHGTVVVDTATGAITYTPDPGFSGSDSFVYQVCDRSTPTPVCDTATVTVTIAANVVDAVDDTVTTAPATAVEVALLGNDTVSSGGAELDPASTVVTGGPDHGTVTIDPATGVATYTPESGFSGVDTFTYLVCDSSAPDPVCDTATVTVTVPNAVDAVDDSAPTAQNTAVTVAALENDAISAGGAPLDPASVVVASAPTNGSVVVGTDGSLTYTPDPTFSGTDTFTYTVCDTSTPTPACDTATVTITVAANTVTANDDVAEVPPGTSLAIGVLANDTVADGGAPLDPTSVSITRQPEHGTVTVDPDTGVVTYTPDPEFSGTDEFSYSVCDTSRPEPVCDSATVTVTVPTVVTAVDDEVATAQNTVVVLDAIGNDTVTPGASPLDPTSVEIASQPANGTVEVDPGTGEITYTPTPGFSGEDTFSYTVCDSSIPERVCDTATVTVTVGANTVAAADDSGTTTPTAPVTLEVLTNDTSATGVELDPASVRVTTPPGGGSATVAADGSITYTPRDGFSGVDTLVYEVCDLSFPTPVCDTATVTITVPSAPVAGADAATTAQNAPVTLPVLDNDTVTPGGAPIDPDSLEIATPPAHGTAVVNDDGSVTYTPQPGFSGPDTFTYTICDTSTPERVCTTGTVTVTVTANVVDAVDDAATTPPATAVQLPVLDNDSVSEGGADLDPGSVTIVTGPAHGTAVVGDDGTITYTPAPGFSGTDSLTYRVCDTSTPTPVCANAVVTIAVPSDPVAAPDTATVPQGGGVTIGVLDNDTVTPGGAPLDPGTVRVVEPPAHGTTSVDPSTGGISYVPDPGFAGEDTFSYEVCDTSSPDPVCVTTTVTVTVESTSVSIVKTSVVEDTNGDGVTSVGDEISYAFVVTNTGTATLDGVGVEDPAVGEVSCPTTSLAAGEEMTCVSAASHTITAADGAAGGVANTATASATARCTLPMPLDGTGEDAPVPAARRASVAGATADAASDTSTADVVGPCPGPITSEASTVWTPVVVDGGLTAVKTGAVQDVDRDGYASVGDQVLWSITVTNPGRTEVTDLRIDDPSAGVVTCPTTTVAPSATVICTVLTTLTAADVAAGTVANTATAFGATPSGPLQSPSASAVVALDVRPAPAPPAPPAPGLPGTGADTRAPLTVALLALLAGAGLLIGARRRRRGGTSA